MFDNSTIAAASTNEVAISTHGGPAVAAGDSFATGANGGQAFTSGGFAAGDTAAQNSTGAIVSHGADFSAFHLPDLGTTGTLASATTNETAISLNGGPAVAEGNSYADGALGGHAFTSGSFALGDTAAENLTSAYVSHDFHLF